MTEPPVVWRIDGRDTTAVVVHDDDVPRLAWFGQRLVPGFDIATLVHHEDLALAHGGADAPLRTTLLPQAALGETGSPALSGHRDRDGFAHRFVLVQARPEPDALELDLTAEAAGLALRIRLTLPGDSDVLTLDTTVTNLGTSSYTVDWLAAATIPLPANHSEIVSHHGRWGLEHRTYRRPIGPGRLDISNLHGRTGHEHAPGLFSGIRGFDEFRGDVLFVQFGWSGNFSLRTERASDGRAYLQAGVLLLPGEGTLAPGETLESPSMYVTRGEGINACSQRFHHHLRRYLLPAWTRTPRPIHANSWEAIYFDHDVDSLLELIDAAAELGAERFVLDDGWFRGRRDDTAGLGDWFVEPSLYPDGLTPLVERVHAHGMQFGLWVEPEMVNPNSDLFRAHPEWVLHHVGIETPLARGQLVLDLDRDDVRAYLLDRMVTLVHENRVAYLKWDMNRSLVLAGDGRRSRAARQPPALYRLLDAITAACPGLEIETCASGGARADLGILRHTGRVWASDNNDPIERAAIHRGVLRFLPPEIVGAHVGARRAHVTGRETSLHTRAIVALQGQYGFELDARTLTADDRAVLGHYTTLYKRHRDWLAECTSWQLETSDPALIAVAHVAETKAMAWVFVTAVASVGTTRAGCLSIVGLDPDAWYRVTLASANLDEFTPHNKRLPQWCEAAVRLRGDLLAALGLPLPVMVPQVALLIACEREEER